jgi:hypothetical protein
LRSRISSDTQLRRYIRSCLSFMSSFSISIAWAGLTETRTTKALPLLWRSALEQGAYILLQPWVSPRWRACEAGVAAYARQLQETGRKPAAAHLRALTTWT